MTRCVWLEGCRNRFEDALLPVELANGIASLSTYPSAKALELFAEAVKKQ